MFHNLKRSFKKAFNIIMMRPVGSDCITIWGQGERRERERVGEGGEGEIISGAKHLRNCCWLLEMLSLGA